MVTTKHFVLGALVNDKTVLSGCVHRTSQIHLKVCSSLHCSPGVLTLSSMFVWFAGEALSLIKSRKRAPRRGGTPRVTLVDMSNILLMVILLPE